MKRWFGPLLDSKSPGTRTPDI